MESYSSSYEGILLNSIALGEVFSLVQFLLKQRNLSNIYELNTLQLCWIISKGNNCAVPGIKQSKQQLNLGIKQSRVLMQIIIWNHYTAWSHKTEQSNNWRKSYCIWLKPAIVCSGPPHSSSELQIGTMLAHRNQIHSHESHKLFKKHIIRRTPKQQCGH